MKRNSLIIVSSAVLLILAVAAFAQGRGNPPAAAPPTPVTINGTVVSFTAGYGAGMPTVVVRDGNIDKTFVLGPFWFLQNAGFTAAAGDQVTIQALACSNCANGYAVVSVTNLTSGKELILRDASGAQLFQNQQRPGSAFGSAGGMQRGGGNCAAMNLPDLTRKASFNGTIVSFTGGPGVGKPELTIATAAGDRTFLVGPYHVVIASGYTFVPGNAVTLTAAPADVEWVALTLKDVATGLELIFRDENGYPVRH